MGHFYIEAEDLHWINGLSDDPEDLCLHGRVKVTIGSIVLEDDGTVSATALYLLKTLEEDRLVDGTIQMIPCCGHFMIPSDDLSSVTILGCNTGTDWSTVHTEKGVRLILPSGEEEEVALDDYRAAVCAFADSVEAFYKASSEKMLPKDEFSKNGYIAFWNEWHRRRAEVMA